MRQSGNNPMTQRGFSIVELMVAMVVSLILLAGVMQVFYSSKTTYLANEQLSRLQENGRMAMDMIQRDIREAGYLGCAKAVPFTNTLATPTTVLWDFANPLQGFESVGAGAWLPAIDPAVVVNPIDGNDVLALRLPVRGGAAIPTSAPMAGGTSAMPTVPIAPAPFAPGQTAMIADCNAAAVFEVTAYDGATGDVQHGVGGPAPGNATDDIGYAFQAGALIRPVETIVYYVRNNAAGTAPSLWRRAGNAVPEEVVEGIQSMQVLYGEDTNGDRLVDVYVRASAVATWQNVLSVNIGLLVQTTNQNASSFDNNVYAVLDVNVGPAGDKRQRMVFSTTAALRNRAI